MKKNIRVYEKGEYIDKEINYIPFRYIIAVLLAITEIAAIIAIMVLLAMYVPYFYIAIYITVIAIVISIISSDENPDYKVPWIVVVIALPIVGMMLYFMFSKRKLPRQIIKKLSLINKPLNYKNHNKNLNNLKNEDEIIYTQALSLCNISSSHLYQESNIKYYEIGEKMHEDIITELKKAQEFIFLEYFIIEEGHFWNSILDVLIEKASQGVDVRVVYDDIGCMSTLPGHYYKDLRKHNIKAVLFSKLRGTIDGEFNNRSHRKILVIDGLVGFTGGVNIADEYINKVTKYGHWKDTGLRIMGSSVNELTRLFLIDYYLNNKVEKELEFEKFYRDNDENSKNFIIPFGDGPNPIYDKNVGKFAIMNLLNHATKYVYITTPYLIIDNELMRSIENAALRGVDVRIVIPNIPDKKLVFELTQSSAETLMKSNVLIYKYTPGFVHAKTYIADDKVGIVGTINLDYRSLTHHFENGVWFYNQELVKIIKEDFNNTFLQSQLMTEAPKHNIFKRFLRALMKLFAPLL